MNDSSLDFLSTFVNTVRINCPGQLINCPRQFLTLPTYVFRRIPNGYGDGAVIEAELPEVVHILGSSRVEVAVAVELVPPGHAGLGKY